MKKAVEAGAKAIILTADSTLGGYREEDDVINQFQFPLPTPNLKLLIANKVQVGNGEGKGIAEIMRSCKARLDTR